MKTAETMVKSLVVIGSAAAAAAAIVLVVSCHAEYVCDEWEVSRDDVTILQELGQGSFGMVYEGIQHNASTGVPDVHVAVKVLYAIPYVYTRKQTTSARCRHTARPSASPSNV